jgi:DNA-binding transcriptional LysR family regulator
MELRQLRYFVAVAEERHFRRAAARLHVAQPAVSEQIKKLEAELGAPLFVRSSRTVELTAAGAAFLRDARRVLRQLEQAAGTVERVRDGAALRLRVGYAPDGVPEVIARALGALRATAPELSCVAPRELLADVREGHLDAAVVTLPAPLGGLRAIAVTEQRAVALAPQRVVEARSATSLEVLARHRLLLLARTSNPAFYDAVTAAFHHAGVAPALTSSAGPGPEHLALEVAAGVGIALVPEAAANRISIPGVRPWPLTDDAVPRCTTAIAVRDEAPSAPLLALLRALGASEQRPRSLPPALVA